MDNTARSLLFSESAAANRNSDRPVPFIRLTDEGRFVVCEDAVRILEAVTGPVAVVSVVGLYRTGKSFLLNQLLGRNAGFEIGPSVNPCTKGIWLWSRPIEVMCNGQLINVVFIDTEGIASFTQNEDHDVKIFSLAVLLSSFFVYNSMGTIDENAVERLSLVAELSKHIRLSAEPATTPGSSTSPRALSPRKTKKDMIAAEPATRFASVFPSFCWLLRDFSLQLETPDGRAMSSRQYLEYALSPQPGDSDKVRYKNQIRQALREYFVDRDCFTLIRPVNSEEQLQQLSRLSGADLRPEFIRQMQDFRALVFDHLSPKKIHGKELNGSMLVSLAQTYAEAINSGGVPVVSSAFETVMQGECQRAFMQACRYVRNETRRFIEDSTIVLDSPELLSIIQEIEATAKRQFEEKAFGPVKVDFARELTDAIMSDFSVLRQAMESRSREQCATVAKRISVSLQKVIELQEVDDFDELAEHVQKALDDFGREARGAHRTEAMVNFVKYDLIGIFQSISSMREQTFRSQQDALVSDMTKRMASAEEARDKYISMYEEARERLERAVAELKRRNTHIKNLEVSIAEYKQVVDDLEKLNVSSQAKVKRYEDEMVLAREVEQKMNDEAAEMQRLLSERENKVEKLEREVARLHLVVDDKDQQLNAVEGKFRADISLLQSQIKRSTGEREQLESAMRKSQDEIDRLLRDKRYAEKEAARLKDSNEKLQAEADALETKVQESLSATRSIEFERMESSRQLEDLQSKVNRLQGQLADAISRAESSLARVTALEHERVQLVLQTDAYSREIATLKRSKDDVRDELLSLKAELEDQKAALRAECQTELGAKNSIIENLRLEVVQVRDAEAKAKSDAAQAGERILLLQARVDEVASLQTQINNLSAQLVETTSGFEKERERYNLLRGQHDAVMAAKAALVEELSVLKDAVEHDRAALAQSSRSQSGLKGEVTRLQEELDTSRQQVHASSTRISDLEIELQEATSRLTAEKERGAFLNTSLEQAQRALNVAQEACAVAQSQQKDSAAERLTLLSSLREVQSERDRLRAKIASLEEELQVARADRELNAARSEALQRDIEAARDNADAQVHQQQALQNMIVELRSQLEQRNMALDVAQAERLDSKTRVDELDRSLRSALKEAAENARKCKDLEMQCRSLEETVRSTGEVGRLHVPLLEEKVISLEGDMKVLEMSRADVQSQLNIAVGRLQRSEAACEQALSDAKRFESMARELEKQLDAQRTSLGSTSSAQASSTASEQHVAELERQLSELSQQLGKTVGELDAVRQQRSEEYAQWESVAASLRTNVKSLQSDLAAARSGQLALENAAVDKERELSEIRADAARVPALRESLASKSQQLSQLQVSVGELQTEIELLSGANKVLQSSVEQSQRETAQMRAALARSERACILSDERVAQLQSELAQAAAAMGGVHATLSATSGELRSVESKLSDAERAKDELQVQVEDLHLALEQLKRHSDDERQRLRDEFVRETVRREDVAAQRGREAEARLLEEVRRLQGTEMRLQDELRRLREAEARSEAEVRRLSQQLQHAFDREKEREKENQDLLNQSSAERKRRQDDLEREAADLRVTVRTLSEDLRVATERAQNERDKYERKDKERDQQIRALEQQLDRIGRSKEETKKTLGDRVKETQVVLKTQQYEIKALRSRLEDTDKEAARLLDEKREADERMALMARRTADLQSQVVESMSVSSGLSASGGDKLRASQHRLDALDAEALLQEIQILNETNRRTLELNRKIMEENDVLRDEIECINAVAPPVLLGAAVGGGSRRPSSGIASETSNVPLSKQWNSAASTASSTFVSSRPSSTTDMLSLSQLERPASRIPSPLRTRSPSRRSARESPTRS